MASQTNENVTIMPVLLVYSIDKLKAKCEERELSTEGTKNQLADRIIIFDNENLEE